MTNGDTVGKWLLGIFGSLFALGVAAAVGVALAGAQDTVRVAQNTKDIEKSSAELAAHKAKDAHSGAALQIREMQVRQKALISTVKRIEEKVDEAAREQKIRDADQRERLDSILRAVQAR